MEDDRPPQLSPPNSFQRTVEEAESEDEMPSLMSVSDSSEEASFSEDEDNSDWEDEDNAELDDEFGDLPPLEPFPGAHPDSGEDMPPTTSSPNSRPPAHAILDPEWLPPTRLPRLASPSDDLIQTFSVFPVGQFPGSTPGQNIPEEITRHLPPEFFQQLVMNTLTGQGGSRQEEPDPERAEELVKGLETVSDGLLARMARVGGAPGGHEDLSGEEENITGCAVCWEPFLSGNSSDPVTGQPLPATESNDAFNVVCLPCSHVFHASCLLPWFSRVTTCPTCRFDIDPESTRQSRLPELFDESEEEDDRVVFEEDLHAIRATLHGGDYDGLLFDGFFGGAQSGTGHRLSPPHHRQWTLPDAPGKSLRERIVERECEMGLRCLGSTCVLGPTDEEPNAPGTTKQISIQMAEESKCKHMVHPACLVMSTRVAGQTHVEQEGANIEVACPSCRAVGTISREAWEEGVAALALVH